MRVVFLLFLAIAAVSAKIDARIVHKAEILTYNVIGRSYAALNSVQDEWSGTLYNATLQYEPSSQGTWARLTDLTFNEVQGTVWNNWNPTHENSQRMNVTGEKFGIVYENDKITKIQVVEGTPLWEVNVIRSVVNLFQITKLDHKVIPSKFNSLQNGQEPYAVFRQMEPAVDGICETLYEMTPLPEEYQFSAPSQVPPKNWIQYVKTTNFSNCEKLPVYNVGLPPTDGRVGSNRMGEFFSRANVGKIVRAGLNGHILTSQATSTVIVSPEVYNQQKGDVFSQMTMNLTGVKYEIHIDIDIKAAFRRTKYVTYTLLNDMSGKPFEEIEEESASSDSESSSESLSTESWQKTRTIQDAPWDPTNFFQPDEAADNIERLLKNMASIEPEDGGSRAGLENFMLLTSVLRSMGYTEMKSAVEKYYNARSTQKGAHEWMSIRDAVTQAGTGPSFLIIKDLIETKKVVGEEAVRMIAAQTNAIRDPHTDLIKSFFELVQSPTVMESFALTTASSSAFTNLIRQAIVDHKAAQRLYPVRANGPMALKDIKDVEETYVPFFGQKMKDAVASNKSHLVQLYIHCLGNIAYPTVIETFEPFLEGKLQLSTLQRTLLVISMKKLAVIYPKLAMSVLYKLYSNEFEPYQVRVAAIYNLMETNPPVDILQRMATYGNVEKSRQVRAALKTAIESAAMLKGEWNIEKRRNAQAAVNLLPSEAPGMQFSRQHLVDYVFQGLVAVESDISYIGSDDDLTPQAIFARGAEYYNSFLTTGYSFSGMISSMRDLIDFMSESSSDESHDSQINEKIEKLKNLLKSLKINGKSKKELEGNVQMNFAGVERFFSFNNSTLRISPETVIKTFLGLLGGMNFNFQSRNIQHEMTLAFPTAMAFPYIFKFAQPSVLAVSGSLKADFGLLSMMNTISIEPNMTVTYASLSEGRMQFVSHGNRSHMAGNERTFRLSTPINGKLSVDLRNHTTQVKVDFNGHKQIEMMVYNAEAFTGIGDVKKPQLIKEWAKYKPLHVRKSHEIESKLKTMVPGVTVHIDGDSEKENVKFFDNIIPALSYALPMAERTIEPTNFRIMLQPDELESIILRADYEYLNETEVNHGHGKIVVSLDLVGQETERYDMTLRANLDTTSPDAFFSASSSSEYLSLSIAGKMPETPLYSFRNSMRPQRDGLVRITFTHGPLQGQRKSCQAIVRMQRTSSRLNHVRTQPQAKQCYSEMEQGNYFHYGCRNATFHAGLYDRYNIEVNYHDLPESVRGTVSQAFSVAKHWGYSFLTESKSVEDQEHDKLRATVQYSPNLKKVDVRLESTAGLFTFSEIPVHNVARSFAVIHPHYSVVERVGFGAFRQQWKPTCSIDDSMMSTFDNCTHLFNPAENHWTVMAASDPEILQTELNNFIILHRVDSSGLRQISATIGGRKYLHTVEINPSFSEMKVFLDNQEINLAEGESKIILQGEKIILKISNLGSNQIQVSSPLIEVVHMATRSVFTLKTENPVMGLCGDNNHESFDMLTPTGKYLMKSDEFIASWTLDAQGSVQVLQRQAEEHGIRKQAPYHSNIISEQDAGRANTRGQPSKKARYYDASSPESRSISSPEVSDEPAHNVMKRLMVIDKKGEICFSTEVQNACKQGRQMIASAKRQVLFVCLPVTPISSHWKMLVKHGARPDFRQKGKPKPIEVDVPLKCSK